MAEIDEDFLRHKKRERENREWMKRGSDEIAPQHVSAHHWLTRWGNYGKERYQPQTCDSMEKLYYKGGEQTPASTAPAAPNPTILAIDREVRLMAMVDLPQQGKTLLLYYLVKKSPPRICYAMSLRFENFSKWMFGCRAMLVNRLRRDGVEV